jgi:hypothetical protein
MIKNYLNQVFIFILLFMTTVVLAQTNTYTGANGNGIFN